MVLTYDPEIEELLGPAGGKGLAGPSPQGVARLVGDGHSVSAIAGGAYDGASRFERELALWAPAIQSADKDILPEKLDFDARTRDMLRSDAYVQAGANLHRDGIVGSMFLLNAKPATSVLGLDETWEEEFQAEVEAKFTLWAESPDNWPDAARINTLTALTRLAVGIYVAAGEVCAAVEWIREPGRTFSTAIQMIDLDRLSNPYGEADSPALRGGVARDRRGAPQGYWFRMGHPGDYTDANSWTWKYVAARKPWGRLQVLHIFEQTRPDQTRGIAEMVAALKEMRITKKFRDIVLQNAVINATYAASIESELPTEAVFQMLGGGAVSEESVGRAITQYAGGYLGAIAQYAGNSRNLQIDGAKIPHLFPGTKLQMRPAAQGGPLGTEFEQSLLRYIAATLGVSYEQLSRDYTETNYSSARAAMNETHKFMMSRKRMVADRFATSIYRLWLEEAINKGQIETLKFRNAPVWYDGMNADALSSCEWIGASRGQIDELKETQAAVLRINNNLTTHEEELARLGKDWRKVFAQKEREQKELESRGLLVQVNDTTNMENAVSGSARDSNGQENNTGESDA